MIEIGATLLSLTDFDRILFEMEPVTLNAAMLRSSSTNFTFLKEFSTNRIVYGVNTGFGPMAQHKIPYADRLILQYNLIRSHASGMGKVIDEKYCRAMLIDRLNTFARCKSGVHPDLLILLCEMLNKNLIPVIYEHGGVGASGDLVQLAHMALAIIGEGEIFSNHQIRDSGKVFAEHHLTPFAIRLREGIALLNGTSCMTGIGLVNLSSAKTLLNWGVLISATINEIFEAFDDHISVALNNSKLHVGQNRVAEAMRDILSKTLLLRDRLTHPLKDTAETQFKEKVQEYYSLRCIPQILGPVFDTLITAENILVGELNSVSDNPIVDHEAGNVFHGGNFHGDYVSLEMDKIKIAITKLGMLAERQLNYLLNDKLNGKLPPFINTQRLGLNFGLQGMQYTATSTVAENQTLSNPVYVHSIPSNNDNQDIVSMGTNAALITARVIDNTFEILAVEVMALVEAIDALGMADKLSEKPRQLYGDARKICAKVVDDMPKYKELASLKAYLKNNSPNII